MATALGATAAKAAPLIVAPWQGEYFGATQGGFYLRTAVRGFRASAQTKFLTGNIQITVRDRLRRREYIVSHAPADPEAAPRELWKLPSGKYEIVSIVLVDTAGVKRTYAPKKSGKGGETARTQNFVIKRQCLSNLGVWTVSPTGADGLAVRFAMAPNVYGERGRRRDSSVAAVVDGFSGLLQEPFGGKRVLEGAATNYEDKGSMRANVTFTRQISMFFSLNLFRHNFRAKTIATILQTYDPNLRRCYTDRLEVNDALKGEVKFTFLLAKATGTMAKLKYTGGTANDPKLAECVYYQLAQMQFPVPENMVGELTYTYDVR